MWAKTQITLTFKPLIKNKEDKRLYVLIWPLFTQIGSMLTSITPRKLQASPPDIYIYYVEYFFDLSEMKINK